MYFVVTIDTEEDSWGSYSATDNPVSNIEKLIPLQKLFDEFKVRPTYLITYPVATNPRSVEILKNILDEGKCEIGMHCHPWNTPPFEKNAVMRKQDTMLCNLPEAIVHEKLATLHGTICRNFGIPPVSFRAGRWGFGSAVARALCQLDYKVDTSISSYTDWRPNHGPNYSNFTPSLFRFEYDSDGVFHKTETGSLLEVPATVGYGQRNFSLCQRITRFIENPVVRKLRLKGILDSLGMVNKIWLSPELSDIQSMMRLIRCMGKNKYSCMNLTFHSNSLVPGLTPLMGPANDQQIFMERMRQVIIYILNMNYKNVTLETLAKVSPFTSASGMKPAPGTEKVAISLPNRIPIRLPMRISERFK